MLWGSSALSKFRTSLWHCVKVKQRYLRCQLEQWDKSARSKLCTNVHKDGENSPFFIACGKGCLDIVKYMINVCKANLELKGAYKSNESIHETIHSVTPLWYAAVIGQLEIVKILIRNGANINSVSNSGSTPVRAACFMSHLEIVKFLVENNADIQMTNNFGGTCLINSVQSTELSKFLLEKGASVNAQDAGNRTALHYAIKENHIETAKILLNHGADPLLKSNTDEDALETACIYGRIELFNILVDQGVYSSECVDSGFDRLGCKLLMPMIS